MAHELGVNASVLKQTFIETGLSKILIYKNNVDNIVGYIHSSEMFEHHKNTTLTLLVGFMVGSLNKVWPWKQVLETRINSHGEVVPYIDKSILPQNFEGEPQIAMAIVLAILGFFVIFGMEKMASKLGKN